MKTHLSILFSVLLLGCGALTGCGQPYTFSDKDGYTCEYPTVGQDISGLVQSILNCDGDPIKNRHATNGQVTFKVTSAKVMQANDVVPSRDGRPATVFFHGHVEMDLPNGQIVKGEDFEVLQGYWENAKITNLDVESYFDACVAPDVLQPSGVERLKSGISEAPTRPAMLAVISGDTSIKALFRFLCGQDLVHQQYDFGPWEEGNRLAMAHADELFCGSVDALPADLAPPLQTVVQAPTPLAPIKQVVDRYILAPAPGIVFSIPIYDRAWFRYKASFLRPRFDEAAWAALAATLPRTELENRLHDALTVALREEEQSDTERGPYGSTLAKVAYVAQPAQARSRSVMALRILVDALQDDVNSKKSLP